MTITTVRPNANKLIDPNVSLVGSAPTMWQALSDNDNSTYGLASPPTAGVYQCAVAMASTTIGASQRVYGVALRAKMKNLVAASRTIGFSLKYGADMSVNGVGSWNGTLTTISTTTLPGPATATSPAGTEWSQRYLDYLVADAELYVPKAGTSAAVVELYADIDIRSQPTVTGQAATNYTDNAQPTITWGYNDPDGNQITFHWVRVFDDATVSSADFDPTTTAAVWDSGPLAGADTSVAVGVSLENGTTYYAYVRVAKDFPLSNSQQLAKWQEAQANFRWWSPWAATAAIPVTYAPPYKPNIQAVTVLADTNQYRAAVQVQVPVNLLSADSAGLETTVGDWTTLSNSHRSRSTVQADNGLASLAVTGIGAGDMSVYVDGSGVSGSTTRVPVDPGSTYTALASFRAAATIRLVQVGIRWHRTSGSTAAIIYSAPTADSLSGWVDTSVTAVAPGDALYADVVVNIQGVVANEVHFVDKASLHVGTSTTWMPGGYANDQGDLLVERGEWMDDARGPLGNMFALQVASGGSDLRTTEGFSYATARTELVTPIVWMWLNALIPAKGDTPAGMLRWTPAATGVGTESVEIGNQQGASGAWNTAYNVPVVPGRQYTFDMWIWADAAVRVTPTIQWRNVTGITVIGSVIATPILIGTTPQQIVITGTCPGGAFFASGHVSTPTVYTHIYLTRFGFGDGTAPVSSQRGMGLTDGQWSAVRYTTSANPLALTDSRFANVSLPPGAFTGQTETIADYEYPPDRPVIYRASIQYTVPPGGAVVKSRHDYAVAYGPPPGVTLLRSVTDPTLQVAVNRRQQATFTVTEDAQIFHPLGADGAPVKIRDWVSGEDGQLTVVLSTMAQYRRLHDILLSSNVVQIQWAQGGRTYALITDRAVADTTSGDIQFCDADGSHSFLQYDVITLSYLETVAP